MNKKSPILIATTLLLAVGFVVFVAVADDGESKHDTCVREAAETFSRELPGYFTPEQIVEQAEMYCRINKELEQQGQGREDAVNELLDNR